MSQYYMQLTLKKLKSKYLEWKSKSSSNSCSNMAYADTSASRNCCLTEIVANLVLSNSIDSLEINYSISIA